MTQQDLETFVNDFKQNGIVSRPTIKTVTKTDFGEIHSTYMLEPCTLPMLKDYARLSVSAYRVFKDDPCSWADTHMYVSMRCLHAAIDLPSMLAPTIKELDTWVTLKAFEALGL